MAEIKLLDKQTIDKIAAGEVVERPSSVVKELVENAIDAKSTAITVEIKEGGIALLRVTDNGSGIPKEQITKAFLRHATSKIRDVNDIFEIYSLGFRGEALSSISAVSQVEFISKTKEELTGCLYTIQGGKEEKLEEVGAPEGTTIVVRNLFFNTPVRKKFLKSATTEGSYVTDIMEHLALSHPEIAFKYILNGNLRFHTNGDGDLLQVIYRIYGREASKEMLPVSMETTDGFRMHGYLGKPSLCRGSRSFETYFVNGRYIKSSQVSKAFEEGYAPFLMQHKFPFVVIHFEIPTDWIDINVHPTKMDVRFTQGADFLEDIKNWTFHTLSEPELIPEVSFAEPTKQTVEPKQPKVEIPEPFEAKRLETYQVKEEQEYQVIPNKIITSMPNTKEVENIHHNVIKQKNQVVIERPDQLSLFHNTFLSEKAKAAHCVLGQVFDTYWMVSFEDKLFFVDQHAAHEKVKYEQIRKRMEEKEHLSQGLQPTVVVTLSTREREVYETNKEVFASLGFEVEAFGDSEYTIRSVPVDLYGVPAKELFLQMLDEILEGSQQKIPRLILDKLASMACKAAVKGNSSFTKEEMSALLDALMELENPYHCPHGRPTMISMTKYEIDRKFKRII